MDWQHMYASKTVDAKEATSKIKRGSRVFIGTGCGEPQHLIRAMVEDQNLQDIMVYQMLSFTLAKFVDDPSFTRRFSLKLFFISRAMRKAAFEGKIDYIPEYLSQIPRFVFFPPHRFGRCSGPGQSARQIRILQSGGLGRYYTIGCGACHGGYCPGESENAQNMG